MGVPAPHGSENRIRTKLVRVTEDAHRQLLGYARRERCTIAEALERLIPERHRNPKEDRCRYCGKETPNARGRHRGHEPTCALYAANKLPGEH